MAQGIRAIRGLFTLWLGCLLLAFPSFLVTAQEPSTTSKSESVPTRSSSGPLELTADHLEYNRERERYEAVGSVVVVQGATRLTADKVMIRTLTGEVFAVGNVHLSKGTKDLWAERMKINVNTEAGIVTNGKVFAKTSNTTITARRFQRFSEDHYRAQEGSFTNCDAMEGQTPAWRFKFEDVDISLGDSVRLKNAWFCVHDVPLIPIPQFSYPVGVRRKTGFLIPSPGFNSDFGFTYRHGFYWAIDPSQDLTVSPIILTRRGYGGEAEYRYALGRLNRGQWLGNLLRDTDRNRTRSFLNGSHFWQITPNLSARGKGFVVSDRTLLQDLGNSGALRALPSADSYLDVRQRLPHGSTYLLGQFLQPLAAGGETTFQRIPEVGLELTGYSPFDGPMWLGLHGNYVYWFREEGFDLSRVDAMPKVGFKPLIIGNAIGITPRIWPRFLFYSRGTSGTSTVNRGTLWASLRVDSRLSRRFRVGEGTLLHTIEPDVIYEFVPPSDQSNIVQIDEVDDLPKKSLLTYKLRNRLLHVGSHDGSSNWMDFTLAQSYRLGSVQTEARAFPFPGNPAFDAASQPIQTPTVPVDGKKFSDVWARAIFGKEDLRLLGAAPTSQYLTIDTFFNPYDANFTQFNADVRVQHRNRWYTQVGYRNARSGNRPRRGDVWNPLSFAEVFDPTPKISFLQSSGALRLPLGLTVGGRILHDFETGQTTEYDVVGLYQNPCRCWSLGVYFIRFPDRDQFNFLISLTDLGSTDSFGKQLLRKLLSPLLQNERGLPW